MGLEPWPERGRTAELIARGEERYRSRRRTRRGRGAAICGVAGRRRRPDRCESRRRSRRSATPREAVPPGGRYLRHRDHLATGHRTMDDGLWHGRAPWSWDLVEPRRSRVAPFPEGRARPIDRCLSPRWTSATGEENVDGMAWRMGRGPCFALPIVPGFSPSSLGPNQDTKKPRPRNSSHGRATIAGHRVTRLRRSVNS